MKALIAQIERYIPDNEQEEKDKETLLKLLTNQEDILLRTNLIGHMTASAWVLNPSHTKILMAHHNLYNAWSWLGGHADGASDLLAVAIREVQERIYKKLNAKLINILGYSTEATRSYI